MKSDQRLERALATAVGGAALVLALSFPVTSLSDAGNLWISPSVLAVSAMLSWAVPRLVSVSAPGVGGLTVLFALLGIGASVPETGAVPLAALVIATFLAFELAVRRHVDAVWYVAVIGVTAWSGLAGSNLRPSAVVAAIFAWWAVLVVPVVGLITPYSRRIQPLAVALVGGVAVVVMARTGGVSDSRSEALLAALVAAAVSIPAGIGASRLSLRLGPRTDIA